MNSKIIIGILADTKEEAIKYCKDITKQDSGYDTSRSDVILETPFCLFVKLLKSGCYCGRRIHYVYAKREDMETEYFREVIIPMFTCGIGLINKGE